MAFLSQPLVLFKASGVGAVSLAESLYILVTGYGLRKGKGWAWTISIIGIFIGFATITYAIIFNLVPITGSIGNQVGSATAGLVIKHNQNQYSHNLWHRNNNIVLFIQATC